MTDSVQNTSKELTSPTNTQDGLKDFFVFEENLLSFIEHQGLPSTSVLVPLGERKIVINNIQSVLERLEPERRGNSVYISKFIAATVSGLFDSALNYLWDETIYELRKRVAQYDLAYFYDVAVGSNAEKRKRLNSEEDLQKIDDSELIKGALDIGLISELGYKHLDFIRYMRNWASAAHPNQNQITGLQLISMLDTCITEVIKLPLSSIVVEIKRLLGNIKNNKLSEEDATQISLFFGGLTQDRANTLMLGMFGIYTEIETSQQTRQNVQLLIPPLWDLVDLNTREQLGIKYGRFIAANDMDRQKLARQFLDTVSGAEYIPQELRISEIQTAIDNLLAVHRSGYNNFYNEPVFAGQLQRIIGTLGIPDKIKSHYIYALIEVFLTNGNGVAWNAEPIYLKLLEELNAANASYAILTFTNQRIASRLQFSLCQDKFRNLVNIMKSKVTMPLVKELVVEIENYSGPLDVMKDDPKIKTKVTALRRVIGT